MFPRAIDECGLFLYRAVKVSTFPYLISDKCGEVLFC